MLVQGSGTDTLKKFLQENPSYEVYDFSQLELMDQCARKYSYKYISRIGDNAPSMPAEFSKLVIHPALVILFKSIAYPTAKEWQKWWLEFTEQPYVESRPQWTAAFQVLNAEQAIERYHSRFPEDASVYRYLHDEIIYWRVLPAIDNAVWVSKPDIMLNRRTDHALVSLETKQSLYPFNRNISAIDRQMLSQAWTTNCQLQLRVFFHFMVSRTNKFEGVDARRDIITPDQMLMNEWLDETQQAVAYIQACKKSGIWPKRAPRSCNDFNRPCPMSELCSLGASRSFVIDSADKINPLEYLGL